MQGAICAALAPRRAIRHKTSVIQGSILQYTGDNQATGFFHPGLTARSSDRFDFLSVHDPLRRLDGRRGPGNLNPGFRVVDLRYNQQLWSRSTSRRKAPRPDAKTASIHHPAPSANDLTWHLDHRRAEHPEHYEQQNPFLGPVLRGVTRQVGHQERRLCLQAPRQARHHLVRPVAPRPGVVEGDLEASWSRHGRG
jgi:hypothetical protein